MESPEPASESSEDEFFPKWLQDEMEESMRHQSELTDDEGLAKPDE